MQTFHYLKENYVDIFFSSLLYSRLSLPYFSRLSRTGCNLNYRHSQLSKEISFHAPWWFKTFCKFAVIIIGYVQKASVQMRSAIFYGISSICYMVLEAAQLTQLVKCWYKCPSLERCLMDFFLKKKEEWKALWFIKPSSCFPLSLGPFKFGTLTLHKAHCIHLNWSPSVWFVQVSCSLFWKNSWKGSLRNRKIGVVLDLDKATMGD